jgi:hypothetical protein
LILNMPTERRPRDENDASEKKLSATWRRRFVRFSSPSLMLRIASARIAEVRRHHLEAVWRGDLGGPPLTAFYTRCGKSLQSV